MYKKLMKTVAFTLAAGAVLFVAGCGDNNVASSSSTQKKLSVAVEASYAPFEYKDEHQHIIGFDVDLMKAVAEKMNAEAEFHNMPFDDIFPAVGEKKINLGISAIGKTERRSQYVSFSDPYYSLGAYVIVVRPGSDIHGVEDLKGKVVVVEKGTTNEDKAQTVGAAKIVTSDAYEVVFRTVEKGQADAAIVDEPGAKYYLEHQNTQLALAGTIPTDEQFVIIMAKDDKKMQQDVNAALKQVMDDGTYDKLSQKWFFNKAQDEKK